MDLNMVWKLVALTMAFLITVVEEGQSQITLIGEKDPPTEEIWETTALHIKRMGVGFYLKWDINIHSFFKCCCIIDCTHMVGLQQPKTPTTAAKNILRFQMWKTKVGYEADKYVMVNFPFEDWINKWLTIVQWQQVFDGKVYHGLIMNGEAVSTEDKEKLKPPIKNINIVFTGYKFVPNANVPADAKLRSLSTFGPQRIMVQQSSAYHPTANYWENSGGKIKVVTEFFSSGEDYYEILAIDNFGKPWELSRGWNIRNVLDEEIHRNVVFEETVNEFGMVPKVTHRFTRINETEQQIYDLVVHISAVSGDLLHLGYIHTNPSYDLYDITGVPLDTSKPKTCLNPEIMLPFTATRSGSYTSLDIIMEIPDCNDYIRDITVLVHHQNNQLTPSQVGKSRFRSAEPTKLKIRSGYVYFYFSKLLIGGAIASKIYYDVSETMDISDVISVVVEVRYTQIYENKLDVVIKKYNVRSHLQEFKGYYIQNLNYECCLAKHADGTATCSKNTNDCVKVKEVASKFETEHGCIMSYTGVLRFKPCAWKLWSRGSPRQEMTWDKTDISFPLLHTTFPYNDDKKYMYVDGEKIMRTSAKRKNRFRQIIINTPVPPVLCYMKDKLLLHPTIATLNNITSWKSCSVECRSKMACTGWSWYSHLYHNQTMAGNTCVLVKEQKDSTVTDTTKYVAGCISGQRLCVGTLDSKKSSKKILSIPDASVLLLNDKLYFCAFLHMDERSCCYKHEVKRYAVKPLASSIVSVLGGLPYSNTLYGRDSKGQLIKFNSRGNSYTFLSDSMFQDVKSSDGFVEAKSYNRTELLQTAKLKDEFVIHGKKYGITYVGIYDETDDSYLVVWLPEKNCPFRIASRRHLALTSCTEVGAYCDQKVSGMYWIQKPLPFNEMLVWCNFEAKEGEATEEMHIIVDENQVEISREVLGKLPSLASKCRIELDFKMMETNMLKELDSEFHIFEIVAEDGRYLAGMYVRKEPGEYYKTRNFQIRAIFATKGDQPVVIKNEAELVLGKWAHFSLARKFSEGKRVLALSVDGNEIGSEISSTNPVFANVTITSGYNQTKLALKHSYIKNFHIYNREGS